MPIRLCCSVLILAVVLPFAGCSESEPEEVVYQTSTMRGLAVAYGQFQSQNRGRPPKDEKMLRDFIVKLGPEWLASYNVASADELFESPRDGKPYVVIYGKPSFVVAHEVDGVDGKRFVADNVAAVQLVDEAKFQEMIGKK